MVDIPDRTIPALQYTARLIRLLVLAGAAGCRCLASPISPRPAPLIVPSGIWTLCSEGSKGDLTSRRTCAGAGLERLRGGGRNNKKKNMGGPQGGRGGLRRGRGGPSGGRGGGGPSGGRGSDAKQDSGQQGDAGVSKADRGRGGDLMGAARGGRGGDGRGGGSSAESQRGCAGPKETRAHPGRLPQAAPGPIRKEFQFKTFWYQVYRTNALLLLIKIMLFSKIHCHKVLD